MTTTEEQPREAMAAQIEALAKHFERMQDIMRRYVEPATYTAEFSKDNTLWEREFAEPDRVYQTAEGARNTKDRRDAAFISDMIRMMDGPEQRKLNLPAIVTALKQAEAAPMQPCDTCGNLVSVNAVSPSECFCSADCANRAAEEAAPGVVEALERLVTATDLRALRGRDHVPSMREEQEARWLARQALARQPTSPPIEVERTVADGALVGELQALLEKASAKADRGRWFANPPADDGSVYIDAGEEGGWPIAMMMSGSPHNQDINDAGLIVALVNAAPRLLALASRQHVGVGGERWPADAKYQKGETVEKKGRASWRGKIVGWYRTDITALGYAVESAFEPGSVQIYPESALVHWLPAAPATDEGERT